MIVYLHKFLCLIGLHERRIDGSLWHCIWCQPVASQLNRGQRTGSTLMLMFYAAAAVMLGLGALCATGIHCVMGD